MIRMLCLLVALNLLNGCANYRAVGGFEDGSVAMYGDVSANLLSGTSSIRMIEAGGQLLCSGDSIVTYVPEGSLFSCNGQKGTSQLSCNDGRYLNATWVADTCTSGSGFGVDSRGKKFSFIFGLDDKEAAQKLLDIASNTFGIDEASLTNEISSFAEAIRQEEQAKISENLAQALVIGSILFLAYESQNYTYAPPVYGGNSSALISSMTNSSSPESQNKICINDFQCSSTESCIKPMGSVRGACYEVVNQHGVRQLNQFRSGVEIRDYGTEQCRFNTDCPSGFKCHEALKTCYR